MSSEGQTLLAELSAQPIAELDEVRVLTRYRAQYAPEMVNAVFAQIKLRARARAKFSRADAMYFTAEGLEQASTERMAMHHATLYERFEGVGDFCSGIGGDLIGFAQNTGAFVFRKCAAKIAHQPRTQALRFADVHDLAVARDHAVDTRRRRRMARGRAYGTTHQTAGRMKP